MSNEAIIYHSVGAFNTKVPFRSEKLISIILNTGLKCRSMLTKEGIFKPAPVQGVFSDEHDNIYFWASQHSIDFKRDTVFAVKVDANNVYVYNTAHRGDASYFEYEASKMPLNEYLKKEEEFQLLSKKLHEGGLKQKVEVVAHQLTAEPVLINKEQFPINPYWLKKYSPEVPLNFAQITPEYFYGYPQFSSNGTLDFIINDTVITCPTPPSIERGIFLEDEGKEHYIPSKNYIAEDFGAISLTMGPERYRCENIERVFIAARSSPNIHFNQTQYKSTCYQYYIDSEGEKRCEEWSQYGKERKIIIGDTRDNTIKLDQFNPNLVLGKEGADTFILSHSHWSSVILDFNNSENDKLLFPMSLYNTPEEVLSHIVYKDNIAIILLGDLGSLLLPDLNEAITTGDIILY